VGATLDGVSVMAVAGGRVATVNTPPVDSLAEFNVETHGFRAEYGRATGGRITFVSKSGTNELHGSVFEIARNQLFDSRSFFEAQKGTYKMHDFGGSLGGPVYIPGLYDGRSKTFFFASAEFFRNRVGASGAYFSVPTPEMYQGDFSNWVDANGKKLIVYDPATTRLGPDGKTYIRDPFPNNKIPVERFSSFAKSIIKYLGNSAYPNVSATPGTSAYVRTNYQNNTGTTIDPWNKWTVKIDHAINANNKVSFLYGDAVHDGPTPGPDGFPGLPGPLGTNNREKDNARNLRGTFNRVFTPTVVYTAFGGVNKRHLYAGSPSADTPGWSDNYGICLKGAVDCNSAFPQITYSDYSAWSGMSPTDSFQDTWSFGNDLTMVRKNHTFKMGYMFERSSFGGTSSSAENGLFGANRLSTSIPGNNTLSSGGGNSFAAFLLGVAYNGQTGVNGGSNTILRSHAFYVQDDWKVTSKLTLNLGVRYEFTLPIIDGYDNLANFNPTKANPSADNLPGALDFAGEGEGRTGKRALAPGWWGGIGPRFGFAYSLSSKTVIRGGAARTFDAVRFSGNVGHFDGFSVLYSPSSTDNGITPAFYADSGIPAFTPPPYINPSVSNGNFTTYWITTTSRLPESYDFTLSMQHRLSGSIVLETAYNATNGAHLISALSNPNQLPYSYIQKYGITLLNSSIDSPAAKLAGIKRPYANIDKDFGGKPPSVAQCLRPYPMYSGIDVGASNGERAGHSTYHSWSTQINRRYSQGIVLQASYVLSKLITDSDSAQVVQGLDAGNPGLEKSLSQFDRTHLLKFSFLADLPFGKGKRYLQSGPLAAILGGWRLAGTGTYQSGTPFQLTNSTKLPIYNVSGDTTKAGKSRATPAQVTTMDDWVVSYDNPDWMGADRYFQPKSYFGTQPTDRFGNAPRYNGKARYQWDLSESISLAKTITFNENFRIDIRADGFNIFNRTKFGVSSTNVDDASFGLVRSTMNSPRRMQFSVKLNF
jgi:hypothetical protein